MKKTFPFLDPGEPGKPEIIIGEFDVYLEFINRPPPVWYVKKINPISSHARFMSYRGGRHIDEYPNLDTHAYELRTFAFQLDKKRDVILKLYIHTSCMRELHPEDEARFAYIEQFVHARAPWLFSYAERKIYE